MRTVVSKHTLSP